MACSHQPCTLLPRAIPTWMRGPGHFSKAIAVNSAMAMMTLHPANTGLTLCFRSMTAAEEAAVAAYFLLAGSTRRRSHGPFIRLLPYPRQQLRLRPCCRPTLPAIETPDSLALHLLCTKTYRLCLTSARHSSPALPPTPTSITDGLRFRPQAYL